MARITSMVAGAGAISTKTHTITDDSGNVMTITATIGAPSGPTFSFAGGPIDKRALHLVAQYAIQAQSGVIPN